MLWGVGEGGGDVLPVHASSEQAFPGVRVKGSEAQSEERPLCS